jgi:1-deoxy-D-xylulose-5-phosphate reductoisomerase
MERKSVTLFGATGTIGINAANLIAQSKDKFSVNAVIARKSVSSLIKLAKDLGAKKAILQDETGYQDLRKELQGTGIEAQSGQQAINDAALEKVDMFLSGAVGFCALEPTLLAIKAGSNIGLANKECLVCAGSLMMDEVERSGVDLIPIDSEHNSLFQVFDFKNKDSIEKIILTASGGPFREMDKSEFDKITPEMAVKHPNWNMGLKISVDSATMMNKGLEVIEAYHLFPVKAKQIDVLVHPQSVIHGMVQYKDGSILAGLSTPDMKVPISYALNWPERLENNTKRFDFTDKNFSFYKPDYEKFECLRLAKEALETGGKAKIALNAANEVAVEEFLMKNIPFTAIAKIVERTMEKVVSQGSVKLSSLDEVYETDNYSRKLAKEIIKNNIIKKAA